MTNSNSSFRRTQCSASSKIDSVNDLTQLLDDLTLALSLSTNSNKDKAEFVLTFENCKGIFNQDKTGFDSKKHKLEESSKIITEIFLRLHESRAFNGLNDVTYSKIAHAMSKEVDRYQINKDIKIHSICKSLLGKDKKGKISSNSIEIAAHCLEIHLNSNSKENETQDIANLLIKQRNTNGMFRDYMDSTLAIEALSNYALKNNKSIDLLLKLQYNKEVDERFHFTGENATEKEAIKDIETSRNLTISTKGTGFGQAHINLEFNIPIDDDESCKYKVNVTAHENFNEMTSKQRTSTLCRTCGFCDNTYGTNRKGNSNQQCDSFERQGNTGTTSRKMFCFQVCIEPLPNSTRSDKDTVIEIEYITGFKPNVDDLKAICITQVRATFYLIFFFF